MREIKLAVPQGLISEPLLLNIFLIDSFFIIEDTDIASYSDDKTPYVIADNIDGVIKSLEKPSEITFKWFNDNVVKINTEKCHLLVSTKNTVKIKTGNFGITNGKSKKLIGVKFDHKRSFDDRISELCEKASRKMHCHE